MRTAISPESDRQGSGHQQYYWQYVLACGALPCVVVCLCVCGGNAVQVKDTTAPPILVMSLMKHLVHSNTHCVALYYTVSSESINMQYCAMECDSEQIYAFTTT